MSRKYTLKEDVYLVLVKYFNGEVVKLNKKDLDDIKKNTFDGDDITPIDPVIIKDLNKIFKAQVKGGFDFIFPKWSNDTSVVKEKLKKKFPILKPSVPSLPSVIHDVADDEPAPESKPDLTQHVNVIQNIKEYDFTKPLTIKKLKRDIKELTDNPKKNKEEIEILDKLNGIEARTNIQFRSLHVDLQNSLQFNFISSFSTTEFSIADEMSQFILETVGEKIRSSNKDKLSRLSIVDATSCIGGNTLSFAKYFSNVDSIEMDPNNFKILEHNILNSKKLSKLYKPSLEGRINYHLGDYNNILPDIKHHDIIFFDPPWGDDYNIKDPKMPMLGDLTVPMFMDKACQQFSHVFVKIPPNLDVSAFKVDKTLKKKKMKLIYRNCPEQPKEPKEPKEPKKPKESKESKKVISKTDNYKYILSQRKAYVKWINSEFYDKLVSDMDGTMFKNYQTFVKGYLSLESPFRGLLVYHGLGTGKTATSIIATEGLSHMRINTLLPKSLKDNYINEIKKFGGEIYDIDSNNWCFFSPEEINSNKKIIKKLGELNLPGDFIDKLHKSVKREIKLSHKDKLKELQKGLFIRINDIYIKDKEIFTVDGELKTNSVIKSSDNVSRLSDIQKIYLDIQIHEFILNKYNFIHSNALPKISKSQIGMLDINDDELAKQILEDDGKNISDRQEIMNKLVEKYKKNKKKNILSPFYNEVIVIDEVHNLISQIKNQRGPSLIFYDWIIESVNTKIIFLSGTPIINKPSEIAYLFNMLKGKINIYDFVLKITGDVDEISKELKNIFYDNISCIEQLHVKKYKGKIIVSFIKTQSNFANILEEDIVKTIRYNDYSFDEFIKQVYAGLHKFTDPKLISPSQKELKALGKSEINYIIQGKEHIFDTETNVIFNKKQKLFEIYDDSQNKIDLTDNTQFMEYFFDEEFNIPPRKQVHLRRMLMGLTSYYPIDRSAISYMPEIKEPYFKNPLYENYLITKKINIVPCFMSYEQFTEYEIKHNNEVEQDLKKLRRKNMFDDEFFHYYSGTRQTCNIIYNEPGDEETKYRLMNQDNNFTTNLSKYSPKMLNIMENMNKFIDNDRPTGKLLLYSVYKSEGGSGAFAEILKANGYEKYDYKLNNIDTLIKSNDKKKRYTFITGDEDEIVKEENKSAYNHTENINGEYIQVMIISQSGAEGISLTCVRQVHIMEPYWNNVRMDQVFGRAIRRNSHIGPDVNKPWLTKDKQNVEQYIYLSMFPDGTNIKGIFESIKKSNWSLTNDVEYRDDFDQYLLSEHKSLYVAIQNIMNMKLASKTAGTTDQMLFDIMERKFNINEKLNNIIKESSVDCIKHTTDDPILNSKCIQFSDKLQNEIAYFPGIDTNELNQIDNMQLKSTFSYFIKPDNIVISATNSTDNIFSYYQINPKYKDEDARYIKENGTILCDFFLDKNKFFVYENEKFYLNNKITNKFSVIQSIYHIPGDDDIYDKYILKNTYPPLSSIKVNRYLVGYKIKYNINDKLFYSPKNEHDLNIYKLYDYKTYLDNGYNISDEPFLIIHNNDFYESE